MRLAPTLLICALGACAPFPVIDTDVDPDAAFPQLVPIAPLLAQADGMGTLNTADTASMAARIAALNARANSLRGPVIDAATRARMTP